jgi:hypothetical protein
MKLAREVQSPPVQTKHNRGDHVGHRLRFCLTHKKDVAMAKNSDKSASAESESKKKKKKGKKSK